MTTKSRVCLVSAAAAPKRAAATTCLKFTAASFSRCVSTGPKSSKQPRLFATRMINPDIINFYKSNGVLETTNANAQFFIDNPSIDHDHGKMVNMATTPEIRAFCREYSVQLAYSTRHIIHPHHLIYFDPRGHPLAVKIRADYARKARDEPLWSFTTSFGEHAVVRVLTRRLMLGAVYRRLKELGYPSGRASQCRHNLRGTLWIKVFDPVQAKRLSLIKFGQVVGDKLLRRCEEFNKISWGLLDAEADVDGAKEQPGWMQSVTLLNKQKKQQQQPAKQLLKKETKETPDYSADIWDAIYKGKTSYSQNTTQVNEQREQPAKPSHTEETTERKTNRKKPNAMDTIWDVMQYKINTAQTAAELAEQEALVDDRQVQVAEQEALVNDGQVQVAEQEALVDEPEADESRNWIADKPWSIDTSNDVRGRSRRKSAWSQAADQFDELQVHEPWKLAAEQYLTEDTPTLSDDDEDDVWESVFQVKKTYSQNAAQVDEPRKQYNSPLLEEEERKAIEEANREAMERERYRVAEEERMAQELKEKKRKQKKPKSPEQVQGKKEKESKSPEQVQGKKEKESKSPEQVQGKKEKNKTSTTGDSIWDAIAKKRKVY